MMKQQPNVTQDKIMQEVRIEDLSINQEQNKNLGKIPTILRKYMDMDNIAEDLTQDQLDKIGSIVFESAEVDRNSRVEWDSLMKEACTLINPTLEEKNFPWQGAANIKFPMVISSCIQFNARTNPEIIKNDKVVEVRAMIPDNENNAVSDRASRLSAHMSYQLLGQSHNWVSDTDKLLMMLPFFGVVYRKTYFNPITGCPDCVLCLPQDVLIDENVRSLESAQRVTHVLYMTGNEIIENMRAGLFLDIELKELANTFNPELDTFETGKNTTTSDPISYTINEDTSKGGEIEGTDYCLEEQHRWLDLDGDDYQEPYIVTIHKDSRKVLRICARYDESSFEFSSKGKMIKINPIEFWTDYHFIPNPIGGYHSFGFGVLLSPLNDTVNTLLNQLIDAGTLANRQSGFIGSGLRTLSGDFSFRGGEWKKVQTATGEDIRKNIVTLPIKEPSTVLFQLMQFLIESSRMITSLSEAMQGEQPPANQPAATTMAMIDQGQQVYSSILYRIYDALKREFKKQYDINKKYLNDEETFPMAEKLGIIKKQDYLEPNYGVFPVADPKVSSNTQRMMQAQALMQLIGSPLINQQAVLENYLEILKIPNPKKYIIQPDPKAPPPIDVQVAQAQIENINADTDKKIMERVEILMDKELKAIELNNEEAKQKSQAAYYGGQLAGQKVDSIVKLAELNREVTPNEVAKATQEEEVLTKGTQIQDMPQDVYQQQNALEQSIAQLLGQTEQQVLQPQQPAGMMPPVINQPQ